MHLKKMLRADGCAGPGLLEKRIAPRRSLWNAPRGLVCSASLRSAWCDHGRALRDRLRMTEKMARAHQKQAAKNGSQLVADNRKARHDFFIEESLEAGLALLGTEVKSLRDHRINLRDS